MALDDATKAHPADVLQTLEAFKAPLEVARRDAVEYLRKSGWSWEAIAQALDTTPDEAQQRYAKWVED